MSSVVLIRNIQAINSIADIVFNENEVHNKTGTHTHRGLGKSKETFTNQKYLKYCGSGSVASSETGTTDDKFWGKTGGHEEKEEGIFESDGEEEEECNFNN